MGISTTIRKTNLVTKTYKCPMVFEDIADIQFLRIYGTALKDTINWVLTFISAHLFDKLHIVCDEKNSTITLWDLYSGYRIPKNATINGRPVNNCIGSKGYKTREILRDKTSPFGIATPDVLHHMEDILESHCHTHCKGDLTLIEECVYPEVNRMMLTYVGKKLNANKGKAKRDNTWTHICHEEAKRICTNDIDARILGFQLEKIGVQLAPILTGEMPIIPKWNDKYALKIGKTEKIPVPVPNIDNDTTITAYIASIEKFIEVVKTEHPVLRKYSLISIKSASFDCSARDFSKYYDLPGILNGVPSYDKKHKFKVHVRMQSGHSEKYYPKTLDGLSADAKISFRIPENCSSGDGEERVVFDAMAHIPMEVIENEMVFTDSPSFEDGVGIDLNEASFFMNTTIPINKIKDGIDWIEAIQALYKANPKDWMFSEKAPARLRNELLSLASTDSSLSRGTGIIPLIGLRDCCVCDKEHNFQPTRRDTLENLFKFMIARKTIDQAPFYTTEQIATIQHTRRLRFLIRSEVGNCFNYFDEHQKWDKSHKANGNDAPKFKDSNIAKELLAEREKIANAIDIEISRLIINGFLDRIPNEMRQFISMEDVDLSETKTEYHTKSLYTTAKQEWGMCDGKLAESNGTITFETQCDFNLNAIKSTEFWNILMAKKSDTGVIVNAEPTKQYIERRNQDFADSFLKKALHFSSLKHRVEEMCKKRSIKFSTVDPKYTSQLCHVCYETLGEKNALKFVYKKEDRKCITQQEAFTKHFNWRKGRTFICGNPECTLCGQKQNSDENAAFNIRLRAVFKRK